jgi:2-polyprenyl-3-methyl-5-hydroxy-6-metoxy-1,4-benzoquinol methylase
VDYRAYYRSNVTYVEHDDPRIDAIVDIVARLRPTATLDVGCGTGWLARRLGGAAGTTVTGVDVLRDVPAEGWTYVDADVTQGLPFDDGSFDCVVAGEVIEHVPDPDAVLVELHRVLTPGGTLVVSTPNMVSWANRLLVPMGIQPLGTETSSVVALGRRLRVLGQGNRVQGHLKVFTHRALAEILDRYGFEVTERHGMPAEFPFPVSLLDRFFTRFVPLASDLLYVATRRARHRPPEPPAQYVATQRRWSSRPGRRPRSKPG